MSNNFLAQILDRKRAELMRNGFHGDAMRERAVAARRGVEPHRFRAAFEHSDRSIKLIAEFKRKSPSRGWLRRDASVEKMVPAYERAGAAAISVLTDGEGFGGSLQDLATARAATHLPVLRKDFILDPVQIYEAAAAGADAVLLIVAALADDELRQLRVLAEEELGMSALVEVHSEAELTRALNGGAGLIGVNNRDLETFTVSIETSERLIGKAPANTVMISESGISDAETAQRLKAAGFHGFLVGETLMRAHDPENALRELLGTAALHR